MDVWLRNSYEALAPLITAGRIPRRRVWGMLLLRSGLTFGLLVSLATWFAWAGSRAPLQAASAWWLWQVTATNIVCVTLLVRFSRLEGLRLRDVYFARGDTWRGDLAWTLLALVVTAVIAQPPGNFLAELLWGDPNAPNAMLFQPLPV
jgi:uncharacterized membrane protein YhaH (DUF805 family)